MANSVGSVEDIVNLALADIGWAQRLGSVYDGSMAAKLALNLYSETRDEVLYSQTWMFARRSASLGAASKTAPTGGYTVTPWSASYPAQPWMFEYAFPSDAIRILEVQPNNLPIPNYDPLPNAFEVVNENSTPPSTRVILSNVASAVAFYTGQVTNMSAWTQDFINMVVQRLGQRFLVSLKSGQALEALMKQQDQNVSSQSQTAMTNMES